jgi:hypothetical protein
LIGSWIKVGDRADPRGDGARSASLLAHASTKNNLLENGRHNRYRSGQSSLPKGIPSGRSTSYGNGKKMDNAVAHLKKNWKVYLMAVWMIGVTGSLYHLNEQVRGVQQKAVKLGSTVDSIESILISTDSNVADMKKQMEEMSSKVVVIHQRVMRR